MSPTLDALATLLFLSMGVNLTLAWLGWRHRPAAGQAAGAFTIGMIGVALYSGGYAMELLAQTLPQKMAWVRFQHHGSEWIAPSWLLFATCLAGREAVFTPLRTALLYLPAILLWVCTQTLGELNLFHVDPRLIDTSLGPMFTYDRGLAAKLATAYYTLCMVLSTVTFASLLHRASPSQRRNTWLLLGASVVPWLSMEVYMTGLAPQALDLTPVGLSVSGVLFWLGHFRYRVLDIEPLARAFVFERLRDGVLVLDHSDHIVDFNPRLLEALSQMPREPRGLPARQALAAYPELQVLVSSPDGGKDDLSVSEAGLNRHYRIEVNPLQDAYGEQVGKVLTAHDDSEVRALLVRLHDLAIRDGLTGAFNHRHFSELADQALYRLQRYGEPLSLISFDLDHFKSVNDQYGHAAGDAVLQGVTEAVQARLRQSDSLGRLGGEEFSILLPRTTLAAASELAEVLRMTIAQVRVVQGDARITVTASLGVAGADPGHIPTLQTLMRQADEAMYTAKNAGRDQVIVLSD